MSAQSTSSGPQTLSMQSPLAGRYLRVRSVLGETSIKRQKPCLRMNSEAGLLRENCGVSKLSPQLGRLNPSDCAAQPMAGAVQAPESKAQPMRQSAGKRACFALRVGHSRESGECLKRKIKCIFIIVLQNGRLDVPERRKAENPGKCLPGGKPPGNEERRKEE